MLQSYFTSFTDVHTRLASASASASTSASKVRTRLKILMATFMSTALLCQEHEPMDFHVRYFVVFIVFWSGTILQRGSCLATMSANIP